MPVGRVITVPPKQATQAPEGTGCIVTEWLGAKIHMNYTPAHQVRKIINHQVHNELTVVTIQGREGTGKTTLARYLGHAIHEGIDKVCRSKKYPEAIKAPLRKGYVIKVLTDEDLFGDFDATMANLPAINRILLFDDLTFAGGKYTKRQIDAAKAKLTKIRHLEDGQDVKTVLIYNFHYSKGLDKYLRSSRFIFFTSLLPEERENVANIMGGSRLAKQKTSQFETISNGLQDGGVTTKEMGPDKRYYKVRYELNNPYRIAMFYDGTYPNFMAFPHINTVAPNESCGICFQKTQGIDPGKMLALLYRHFGSDTVSYLLKFKYYQREGSTILKSHAAQASEVISRCATMGIMNQNALIDEWLAANPNMRHVRGKDAKKYTMINKQFFEAFKEEFGIELRRRPSGELGEGKKNEA